MTAKPAAATQAPTGHAPNTLGKQQTTSWPEQPKTTIPSVTGLTAEQKAQTYGTKEPVLNRPVEQKSFAKPAASATQAPLSKSGLTA